MPYWVIVLQGSKALRYDEIQPLSDRSINSNVNRPNYYVQQINIKEIFLANHRQTDSSILFCTILFKVHVIRVSSKHLLS